MTEKPLLSVRNLKKHYPIKKGLFSRKVGAAKAVDGISFELYPGETLGIVGESGCGKSTAATTLVRLQEPTSGEILFNGGGRETIDHDGDGPHPNDVTTFDKNELKAFRRDVQMVFQDPSSSFDPRMTVGDSVAELLYVHGMTNRAERRTIVEDLLERVGMSASDYDRYPHEFSGGQKQRIALARALVLDPELIIADEPVSALDVSIQGEVLSLIDELQSAFGLSLILISHDMGVIREICDRVAVMYLGKIVEIGTTEELFTNPQHPYTEALVSAVPVPDPRARGEGIELKGSVPSPSNPPSGCRFHTRCHRVVQPDRFDIEQADWRGILNLRDRVLAGSVDIENLRINALSDTPAGESEPTQEEIRSQIRAEFDISETTGDPDVDDILNEALTLLIDDELESAGALLADEFVTPCEEVEPSFTEHGDGHQSACIRHESEHQSIELSADD